MSESHDEISRLGRQLDKAIRILGDSSIDNCPNDFGFMYNEDCFIHTDCQRCWEDAISTIE